MATQNDIDTLKSQIGSEQQSASLLDEEIRKEEQNTAQKVAAWQQKSDSHRQAADRMQQDLKAKQDELQREQQKEAEDAKAKSEQMKKVAGDTVSGLF